MAPRGPWRRRDGARVMAVRRSGWAVLAQMAAYLALGVGFIVGLGLGPWWAWAVATFYGMNAGIVLQAYWATRHVPDNVVPFQRTTTTQR